VIAGATPETLGPSGRVALVLAIEDGLSLKASAAVAARARADEEPEKGREHRTDRCALPVRG
jgi:hypothetical protein